MKSSSLIPHPSSLPLLAALADIAEQQIGDSEDKPHRNTGKALDQYFAADDYVPQRASNPQSAIRNPQSDDGYPWCASFVSWCVQEFLRSKVGQRWFARTLPPRIAAAFAFEKWGDSQGALVFTPKECRPGTALWPMRGDIVTYTFSHVGIVAAANQSGSGIFTAIEGNSNADGGRDGYAVVRHGRKFFDVRRFIRLTPAAEEAV